MWSRLAGLLAGLAVLAAPVRAQDSSMTRRARVTYLTSASAYVDAGKDAGLREGTLVQVIRGGAVIGVLKVAFLASRQASCDIVSESTPIVVGDSCGSRSRCRRAIRLWPLARRDRPGHPAPRCAATRARTTSSSARAQAADLHSHPSIFA